jgi:hypothetical protein
MTITSNLIRSRLYPLLLAHPWIVSAYLNRMPLLAVLMASVETNVPKASDINSKDGSNCMITDCGGTCPSGFVQMTGEALCFFVLELS